MSDGDRANDNHVAVCPECDNPLIRKRSKKKPPYYCDICKHEFEEPQYRKANRGGSRIDESAPEPPEGKIWCCPSCDEATVYWRKYKTPDWRCGFCATTFDQPNTRDPRPRSRNTRNTMPEKPKGMVYACPNCDEANPDFRKTLTPAWRCGRCGEEFEEARIREAKNLMATGETTGGGAHGGGRPRGANQKGNTRIACYYCDRNNVVRPSKKTIHCRHCHRQINTFYAWLRRIGKTKHGAKIVRGPLLKSDSAVNDFSADLRPFVHELSVSSSPASRAAGRFKEVVYLDGQERAAATLFIEENLADVKKKLATGTGNVIADSFSKTMYDILVEQFFMLGYAPEPKDGDDS